MRETYLDKLNKNGNNIDWVNSIYGEIDFIYDDITGKFIIVKYDKPRRMVTILYCDKEFDILTGSLKNARLGNIVLNKDFIYKVGDVIETKKSFLQIKECFKNDKGVKSYLYVCDNCGNEDAITESHLKSKRGCNVCCGNSVKVLKGYNDFATYHPEFVENFVNKEEAYTSSYNSGKKYEIKCPDCGSINNKRLDNIHNYGFRCDYCRDKKSYGEKLINGFLAMLNIDYKAEYCPLWSNKKRYDFYISSLNIIIEVNGLQHYEEVTGFKRTLQEELENDKYKKQLALANGIKEENYIVIDCRYSELDFIKQNILHSTLTNIFNLADFDWNLCSIESNKNILFEICNLWNNTSSQIKEIALIVKTGDANVRKYLKRGNELGLCEYIAKSGGHYERF